jgi:hypothetical protein
MVIHLKCSFDGKETLKQYLADSKRRTVLTYEHCEYCGRDYNEKGEEINSKDKSMDPMQ